MFSAERHDVTAGYLVGGAYEFPVGPVDLNLGASFQRLGSPNGSVILVNAVEATAMRRARMAPFFGVGFGPIFTTGPARPGAKIFAGLEFFHGGTMPVQLGMELIMKFCDSDTMPCPAGDRQTWVAGRLGFRL
jgi:hypothetical protein